MKKLSLEKMNPKNFSKKTKWIAGIIVLVVLLLAIAGFSYKAYEDTQRLSGTYTYKEGGTAIKFNKDSYKLYSKTNKSETLSGHYYVKDNVLVLLYDKDSTAAKEGGIRGVAFQLSNNKKRINLQGSTYKK
ncbi:hypothetical protein LQZ24_06055 [Fructobacillus sp. M1-13]|uniref:Uncharacterized protein n=1 Tax=Fructobacillus papyriferae TaxID=2713171 RepID=A0ABS5QP87_9LACO|nr:hypothetical protein [Fructobacillus papyriferae]MBS9334956.1 hypothetical protein [Fructobacillus papyriferae]MCD2159560.1 hypothetical protein [Fructobacillus papyriferae]